MHLNIFEDASMNIINVIIVLIIKILPFVISIISVIRVSANYVCIDATLVMAQDDVNIILWLSDTYDNIVMISA